MNTSTFFDDQFNVLSMFAGGECVSLYDVEKGITRFSKGAVEFFGLPAEFIENGKDNWLNYIHPDDRKRYQDTMDKLLAGETFVYDLNCRVKTSDGNYGLFRFKGGVIRNDEGSPVVVGGVISNEGLMEYTDSITALRNESGFFNDLSAMLAMQQHLNIMLIGIVKMKDINAEYGYGYGNKLIQRIAWLIQECIGADGILYRMDGSKFAIMSNGMDMPDMEAVYDKIKLSLKSGIVIDEIKNNIITCGSIMSVDDFEVNERTIYTCLNEAYSESKDHKNGGLVAFNNMEDDQSKRQLEMINEIRNDMVNDCENFHIKYQPVICTKNDKTIGVEALVRYESDRFGEVMPADFIPVLENDFAFEEMGIWIINQAMKDCKILLDSNPDLILGINISASQFEDIFFEETLFDAAEMTDFPLGNVCLELSKDCRLIDWTLLNNKITALRDKGVKILLDDFGSGYASLEIIKNIAVDCIKFDMQFVKGIENDETAQNDLKGLFELAKSHNIDAYVKGIETKEVIDTIRDLNISGGQGFFYDVPKDIEEIV